MYRYLNNLNPYWAGKYTNNAYAIEHGLKYLSTVRSVALIPAMVDLEEIAPSMSYLPGKALQTEILAWIGNNIDSINAQLTTCLQACHDCFYPHQRPQVEIWATPIASRFAIDALCNVEAKPRVILMDVGRIAPSDWLRIVAHEYAHAQLGYPGHGDAFLAVLEHLCLGLGIEPPGCHPEMSAPEKEARLQKWPPCDFVTHPIEFWRGVKL
ncbi:hypothetical protein [Merismopedia glauca]|uniref:hypothetical protein n=1 Tax=Merismopedia glauca TaxID=292586 RepID=UPI001C631F75|nr:hypothetical protein [Merismopedia glauca]